MIFIALFSLTEIAENLFNSFLNSSIYFLGKVFNAKLDAIEYLLIEFGKNDNKKTLSPLRYFVFQT